MEYKLEDTILYVENVSVGYDDKVILNNINFIEKNVIRDSHKSTGQTIAIVGRSGRGKSTLFKSLTGLLKPLTGQILITNLSKNDTNGAKILEEGDVGFVDQKYTLFRHKTIWEICKYSLRNSNLSQLEKNKLITEYLTEWELISHKDKYPCDLSGGQRQRTAIVEQIISSKKFIILDEPTSGLDIQAIEVVKKSFNKILNDDEYNTIIFSTHNIEFAVEMADSIYVIGYENDNTDYSTIVKHYDLKELGLAWKELGLEHYNLIKEIKEKIINS